MALELAEVVEKVDPKAGQKADPKADRKAVKVDPKKGDQVLNEKVISTNGL